MQSSHYFGINAPTVIEQAVDDETLVVHLELGHYFSLRGSSQVIWAALVSGATLEAILSSLEQRYSAPRAELAAALDAFVGELLKVRLIVAGPAGSAPSGASPVEPSATPKLFVAPELTRYTDIEDMLTVDPIHEVDDTGWPRTPAN